MSEAPRVYILGGSQTDFERKWSREGKELFDLFSETLQGGLEATDLDPSDIQSAHVGNFAAELFSNQGHLGGFFAQAAPELRGCPASRHEAACASGSMALLAATAEIEAGRYDLVCVLGIEMMRHQATIDAARFLGAAAWVDHEFTHTPWVWPAVFAEIMDEYQERYGLNEECLSEIARHNFYNARANPNAQTRRWQLTDRSFGRESEENPLIEGRLRKYDCSQVTDGGAIVFLASRSKAEEYATKRGISIDELPYIKGWGHRTTSLLYRDKFQETIEGGYLFPQVHQCFLDAYRRAGIKEVTEIDGLETHDCFSITQYMAIEHCGLTKPGEAWRAIEGEWVTKSGHFPVNPSGGLMGLGHPVGATGVRMLLDASKQTRGTAGDYQIPNAKNWMTYNVGGSTTTSAAFIVGRD